MIDYRRMIDDAAEPEYAAFSSGLIPGVRELKGVRLPVLRRMAREIAADDWRSFLRDTPQCFEEIMLRGFVIAYADMPSGCRLE